MENKLYGLLLCLLFSGALLAQDQRSADNYFDEQNFEAALDEYLMLLEDEPDNQEYNYRVAICYLNTNIDRAKAVDFLEEYTNQDKFDYNALYLLGRAYHFAYKFDKAIEKYQEFLEIGKGTAFNIENAPKQIEYCENAKELIKFPVDVTFENLGTNINSLFPDYYPFVPIDESFIFFNTRRDDGSELLPNGAFHSNIYHAKVKDGKYSEAKPITDKINSPDGDEEIVGMSADGTKLLLYFDNKLAYGDIYSAEFVEGEFTEPVKIGKTLNSRHTEIAASITNSGDAIYFASDRPGGYGGVDIYVTRKLPNGEWGPAQNLGPSINTAEDEDFPNISPDGKTLYFSSKGHTSMGGYDIFKATWNSEKRRFSGIQNLGFPINTPEDNMNFRVSENGRYGYISAVRAKGHGDLDIYRVTFNDIETEYTVITGHITSSDTTMNVNDVFLSITDLDTDMIYGDYYPNMNTMRYVMILPPGRYNLFVEADGFEEIDEDIEIFGKGSFKYEIKKDIVLEPY